MVTVSSLAVVYGSRGASRRQQQAAKIPGFDKPAEDAVVGCFGAALSDEGVARSANRFYDYGFLTRAVQGRRQMATLVLTSCRCKDG